MWHLDGTNAQLKTSRFECNLDLAAPDQGATEIRIRMSVDDQWEAFDASLFQLVLPCDVTKLEDAYVRGDDLVATYSESTDYPCRIQLYWRLVTESNFVGLEIIVSAQTSLLDSTPAMMVTSRLPVAVEICHERAAISKAIDSSLRYVQLADESHVEQTVICESSIATHLFPDALEKGVICRARLAGYFLATSAVEQEAASLHKQFTELALPLTT